MAITKQPENTTYNTNLFLSGVSRSLGHLGATLPRRKKKIQVGQYQNLSNIIRTGTPQTYKQTYNTPPSFTSLGTITTPYGASTRYEKFHHGVDIANRIGTPIPAFTAGTVSQVGVSPAFGNFAIVKDANGNYQRYSHLQRAWVKVGQPIQRGAIIGAMGNTGQTYSLHGGTGSHLDYRIYDAYQHYINPYKYLKEKYYG